MIRVAITNRLDRVEFVWRNVAARRYKLGL
jgi:hypothetical protein